MIRRRNFLALAAAAATFPRVALGQQASRLPKVAYFGVEPLDDYRYQAFLAGLQDTGRVPGKNIAVETFVGPQDQMAQVAPRVLASGPDVIFTVGAPPATAAKALTDTIPIIISAYTAPFDLVGIASPARPGGNVTGTTNTFPGLAGKQVEAARDIFPGLSRVGMLWGPDDISALGRLSDAEAVAKALGFEIVPLPAPAGSDLDGILRKAAESKVGAVIVIQTGYLNTNVALVSALAVRYRLPLIAGVSLWPQAGALANYGSSVTASIQRAASLVDVILKGAKPAELPVEQPSVIEFVVNLKTAKAIGIAIPPAVLSRATQVIE